MAQERAAPIFFFAPFVSSTMRVEPQWIDYNGHLNMAYYHVLFDRAVDEAFELVGLGQEYLQAHQASYFTAEIHTLYKRELKVQDPVRVTLQLVDHDDKRMHYYMEIRHADEGWVSATCEMLSLHVCMATRQVTPFPGDIRDNLSVMKAAHGRLPTPATLGRVIGVSRRESAPEPLLAAGTRH